MNIQEKWLQLSQRERKVALIAMTILALLIYFFVIFVPLSASIEDSQQRFKANTELLGWMQQAQSQLRTNRTSSEVTKESPASLLTIIDQSIKGSPIETISPDIKQVQTNQVQITLTAIQFDQLLNWLEKLSKQYHLTIVKITLKRAAEEGIVSSSITLGT